MAWHPADERDRTDLSHPVILLVVSNIFQAEPRIPIPKLAMLVRITENEVVSSLIVPLRRDSKGGFSARIESDLSNIGRKFKNRLGRSASVRP